jgi:hypothetical protein
MVLILGVEIQQHISVTHRKLLPEVASCGQLKGTVRNRCWVWEGCDGILEYEGFWTYH